MWEAQGPRHSIAVAAVGSALVGDPRACAQARSVARVADFEVDQQADGSSRPALGTGVEAIGGAVEAEKEWGQSSS